MTRIQHILEKAEREGVALRTSRLGPTAATVSIPIELPGTHEPAVIAPAGPQAAASSHVDSPSLAAGAMAPDGAMSFTVRLNPLLVAGLAPKSLAAEQYRALRTRLGHAESSGALRTVLVTSP